MFSDACRSLTVHFRFLVTCWRIPQPVPTLIFIRHPLLVRVAITLNIFCLKTEGLMVGEVPGNHVTFSIFKSLFF